MKSTGLHASSAAPDHVEGPLCVEELAHCGLAGEVQLRAGAADDVGEAQRGQAAVHGGAQHAFVAAEEDLRGLVGEERRRAIVGNLLWSPVGRHYCGTWR